MSIDDRRAYIPARDWNSWPPPEPSSDRVIAYDSRDECPDAVLAAEVSLKRILMALDPPNDCHWWRPEEVVGGEIVTIAEHAGFGIRGPVVSSPRRAFLRQGNEWRRLAQDPNVDYLFRTGDDPAEIRVYCAGPIPGWVRHDELVKA